MAKKSKTQRAKASAKRAQRKEEKARAAEAEEAAALKGEDESASAQEEPSKKSSKKADKAEGGGDGKKKEKKSEKKKKKRHFGFFKDVKAEMKRVTWPSKEEVLRWSGVVIVALLFFGVFAWAIDTVSEVLLSAISGLGANL